MKRGLKAPLSPTSLLVLSSYNRYPDEKGTERINKKDDIKKTLGVTTVTPMKRGLKDLCYQLVTNLGLVTTVTPMKRGLKAYRHGTYLFRSVTTVTPMKRGLKVKSSSNVSSSRALQPLPR